MSAVSPDDIVWSPNPPPPGCEYSSQELFLSCPLVEALIEGGRGTGKTTALLVDFAKEVGQGLGPYWRGILFRETFRQLEDVILKSQILFRQVFPEAVYNGSDHFWQWPDGERLFLSYMRNPEDYWNYHGWELPWIGWEELCNWADLKCYQRMMSCNRSSHPEVARRKRVRATTNPYGKGHAAVRAYFVDPAEAGVPIQDPKTKRTRVRLYSPPEENVALTKADPTYRTETLGGIDDENVLKAWEGGPDRWNINAGAYFADVWSAKHHVLEPFDIPASWALFRAFDWGSSKPFSVGWYAVSDGCEVKLRDSTTRTWPRATIFRVAEWYGWNGKPNEGLRMIASAIAQGILEREQKALPGRHVDAGPADTGIFDTQNGVCIADDMALVGIRWTRADKGPGSRKNGWEKCRALLTAAKAFPVEEPAFFLFSTCRHFIRTVPVATRDEKDLDDIDSSQEDHVLDEWRYAVSQPRYEFTEQEMDI